MDFEDVEQSTQSQLKSLVLWALKAKPQVPMVERPFTGSVVQSVNVLQYQIEDLPDTPMYVHSYRKSLGLPLYPSGNNQLPRSRFQTKSARSLRSQEGRPRKLSRRRRHASGVPKFKRASKLRSDDRNSRQRRSFGKQERDVTSKQREGTSITAPGIVVESKNEAIPKPLVDTTVHSIKQVVNDTPSNKTDDVFGSVDHLSKSGAGFKDLASKTNKEETEKMTVTAKPMILLKASPFDERQKPDGMADLRVVRPKKPSAESGIHGDRQTSSDSSSFHSGRTQVIPNVIDKTAVQVTRNNPQTSSDSINSISGQTRTKTANINKTALQFDSGKSQKTAEDKSVMTLTPIQLTTLVGRLASLFDPQRTQNIKPAPQNKGLPPTPSSETSKKVRHTQNPSPPFAIAHQLNDLMRFLYQLTGVQRTGLSGIPVHRSKPDDHRKQSDKPKNPLGALLGKGQEAGKEVAVEFHLMIEERPKGGQSEGDAEMAVISVQADSAPVRQSPKVKGLLPEQKSGM